MRLIGELVYDFSIRIALEAFDDASFDSRGQGFLYHLMGLKLNFCTTKLTKFIHPI